MKYLFLFLLVFTSGAAVATEPGSQYQQQAEAGDRRAQYYLADTWVSSGDYQKAEYWAQKAAAQGDGDALALLARNKAAFSAGNLEIVSGTAPAACEALPAPTHVFLGGTAGNLNGILDAALRKNPHVRIVATAVTLESVGALAARMADFEKVECVSLQAARARTAGSYHLMQGQNPVYIFTMQNRREQA